MRYYSVCKCEHAVKNPMICFSNIEELGVNYKRFDLCKPYEEQEGKITFYVRDEEDDGDPDDALQNTDMIPVFSPRLVTALNEADIKGIQYAPCNLVNYKKENIEGFCIANVLDHAEQALVLEKSMVQIRDDEYREAENRGKIYFVWRYALDEKQLEGHDVFRLKFDDRFEMPFSSDIVVSQRFRDVFTKNKFTGFSFSKIAIEGEEK